MTEEKRPDREQAPLRVLAAVRLFTGLQRSLTERRWAPSGAPAIYRLLERLAKEPGVDADIVFLVRDPETAAAFPRGARFEMPPLGQIRILPYRRLGGPRLSTVATEVAQAAQLTALALRRRTQVAYFTNAAFPAAALFARLGLAGVVLRIMGLFPHHRALVEGRGRLAGLQRWLYRAPFDHVICTEEGSGAQSLLPKLLAAETPLSVLLNGVEASKTDREEIDALRADWSAAQRPIVLFLGRLVSYKGCDAFVEAALTLLARDPGCAQFHLIGDGERRAALAARVKEAGRASAIHLHGPLPHAQVNRWLAASDVYVSGNLHGNLSNANLEALANGCCLVLPESDPASGRDLATDAMIPPDVAPRYRPDPAGESLAEVLQGLLDDGPRRAACGRAAARIAGESLGDWETRIAREIDIIRRVAHPDAERRKPENRRPSAAQERQDGR